MNCELLREGRQSCDLCQPANRISRTGAAPPGNRQTYRQAHLPAVGRARANQM